MELRHIRYFIAVAEELNFTRAAEKLFTAQPSLSQQIRDLESEIGVKLFSRTKRKVELTKAGEVFLKEARLVLQQANLAIQVTRDSVRKSNRKITMGFVPSAEVKIFPKIMPFIRQKMPSLNIELKSLNTIEQEEALVKGDLDVAFLRQTVEGFKNNLIYQEELVLVMSVEHPLALENEIPVNLLQDQNIIVTDPNFSGALGILTNQYLKENNVKYKKIQNASNILFTLNLVSMGMGVAILPDYVISLLNPSICFKRMVNPTPPTINLYMLWHDHCAMEEFQYFLSLMEQNFNISCCGNE